MADGFAITRPWNAARGWLRNVPVVDDVDRRNAPALQVVLLMLALFPPATWLLRAIFGSAQWRPGEFAAMLGALGLSLLAAAGVVLIRQGRFQLALRLLLGAVAILLMNSYVSQGLGPNRFEAPIQVVWLVIAGLMAGRRVLWLLYLWMALALGLGAMVEAHAPASTAPWQAYAVDGLVSMLIFLFIAIVVDRGAVALRESLAAARARGDELARAKTRLEAEIVERERLHDQLVHSQKVEAVGRLAAGVAHDFNHLLNLMLGYAARGMAADSEDQMRAALHGVESAARRAGAVSRKLTTFSHRGATSAEVFDVNTAVAEMQPMLRQLFGPDVRIHVEPAAFAQNVCMDRGEFELVVLNLAANANAAMPDGGVFRIDVVALMPARVAIVFSDTGHGMDESVRRRVFEAFFTTRPEGQGSGLGLAVASDIVSACGGTLDVDSTPGQGATFRMELPLAEFEAEDDARRAPAADASR